eukprot:GAHX01001861.1.p1 GENE.GAHX01001861.1~~GAHX01001861.1.p1  ORF type:complete len:1182 (-),score=239.94 GAHX01001861.1:42-3587(-)
MPNNNHFASFHINSFNNTLGNTGYVFDKIKNISPFTARINIEHNLYLRVSYLELTLEKVLNSDHTLTPAMCRISGKTYSTTGRITIKFELLRLVEGNKYESIFTKEAKTPIGELPIMIGSQLCLLDNASDETKHRHKEDTKDKGGYFIVDGTEIYIRNLLAQKSNMLLSHNVNVSAKYGGYYKDTRIDFNAEQLNTDFVTNTLHLLKNNLITIKLQLKRALMFPIFLLLKLLSNKTDKKIFDDIFSLIKSQINYGNEYKQNNTFIFNNLFILLKRNFLYFNQLETIHKDFYNQSTFKFFGNTNAPKTNEELSALFINIFKAYHRGNYNIELDSSLNDEEQATKILDETLLIQCKDNLQKYHVLINGLVKLFLIQEKLIFTDNKDTLDNLKVVPSGFLYFRAFIQVLSTKRYLAIERIKKLFKIKLSEKDAKLEGVIEYVKENIETNLDYKVQSLMNMFLQTGTLRAIISNVPIKQSTGLAQRLERINFITYANNMSSVHRGSFFVDSKNTKIRKLRPETFGFLCPVNTPDGDQCGLLSCLTSNTIYSEISIKSEGGNNVVDDLVRIIQNYNEIEKKIKNNKCVPVLLNGFAVGFILKGKTVAFCDKLTLLKKNVKFQFLSISNNATDNIIGRFKCVDLSLQQNLLFRPVYNIAHKFTEYISPTEQAHMNIYCFSGRDEYQSDLALLTAGFTHKEVSINGLFSTVASWTPYSNTNPSPRNMYQCTMLKQSLSFPTLMYKQLAEKKVHVMSTLQKPITQNINFGNNVELMNERPTGVNIVIGVLSYTGYDMEDALILNKASLERGLFNAFVITRETIDFTEKSKQSAKRLCNLDERKRRRIKSLSVDGLPEVGTRLTYGDPMYSFIDSNIGNIEVVHYKKDEPAIVDAVYPVEHSRDNHLVKAVIKLRISRYPRIGDKFSSRHGQKGTVSILWPAESMPFNDKGIAFDVIINPHAFPSRMTVGMLIEIISAKIGCLEGEVQDSSPFMKEINKLQNTKVESYDEYYKKLLVKNGFDETGEETVYSGITGNKFKAKVFMGVCYYQRLKQMVNDKSQVRACDGGRNALTRQPVKGRKNKGGLRFGEMERDSLIAHGASYLLKERLLNVSDPFMIKVCSTCNTYNNVVCKRVEEQSQNGKSGVGKLYTCLNCKDKAELKSIMIPFATNYLVNELYAMGIGMKIEIKK